MVSRSPLLGDAAVDTHQAKAAHIQSKIVVKETQREPSVLESPKQSKKEGRMLDNAQDVAELKDYVRLAADSRLLISNWMPATW